MIEYLEEEREEEHKESKEIRTDLPELMDRIKAMFIDVLVIVGLIAVFASLFDKFNYEGETYRICAGVFLFLYDPVMISFGGTIGHRMMNLRVRRFDNEAKNLPLYMALIRYIVKAILGWISLLTVSSSEFKLAIHDQFSNSIVVKQSPKT